MSLEGFMWVLCNMSIGVDFWSFRVKIVSSTQ